MSIIHEALKKTEATRTPNQSTNAKKFQSKQVTYIVLLVMAIALSVVFLNQYRTHQIRLAQTPVHKAIKKVPTLIHPRLSLSGVFISDKFSMAMINNHLYKMGDTVEGMKISRIDYNSVRLINGSQMIDLTSG